MTVCCQNLALDALNSRSALIVLVGAVFKKFGLFLNTPRMSRTCFSKTLRRVGGVSSD